MAAVRIPACRLHKPTGQARVILNGKHHYLGPFDSPASREKYARLIAEHFSNPAPSATANAPDGFPMLSVNEAIVCYMQFAKGYFVKNGKLTGEYTNIRCALGPLRIVYGMTAAREFGPRGLKTVRQHMVDHQDLCRASINSRINRIRRMFKWLVSEELIPPTVHHALCTVTGLRIGRSPVRESQPVRPVADDVVEATLGFLPPVVADMIRIQRLTGMRPGDIVRMRPTDVDRLNEIWVYEPREHKMQHFGHRRLIPIGPKAQMLLGKYLNAMPDSFVFSPRAAVDWHMEQKRLRPSGRKTPVYPSERRRVEQQQQLAQQRRHRRQRMPGERYETSSYRRAIEYALADAARAGTPIQHWHPNQLRHSRGTEVRREFGLEGAQVTLGHAHAEITQIYAERDLELAKRIAKMTG